MIYLAIAVLVFALSGLLSMAGLGAAFIFVPLFYWLGVPLLVAAAAQAPGRAQVLGQVGN